MNVIYNEAKLTPIFEHMGKKKVAVVGAGAIGSLICEALTRNGVGYLRIFDMDRYEPDNLPKSSFVIRYPEDLYKNKAIALAERLGAVSKEGTVIEGMDINLQKIGPYAMSGFDYVVLALDNLAMKIFAQKLVKQCVGTKPMILSCGTTGEYAEAMIFSPNSACLRCTIPNSWLTAENPETVHSCAEVINYRLPQKALSIVSTSGIASMKSAVDIDDMITAHACGVKNFENSERYSQNTYPNKEGHGTKIAKMKNCPVCQMKAPENITVLDGATETTTLRQVLTDMSNHCNCDIKLKVHTLAIPGVPEQIYNQFVITGLCSDCGTPFRLLKHAGDIRKTEVVCDDCRNGKIQTHCKNTEADPTYTSYFSLNETDDDILDLTLFQLGYPIGAYYEAELINEPEHQAVLEAEEIPLTSEFDFDDIKCAESVIFALSHDKFIN